MTWLEQIAPRATERTLFSNAAFLMANTIVGSLFGFLFWLIAARSYSTEQVGLGAAYISAIVFLATLADLGLSTALIRFAPTTDDRVTFINSVLVSVAISTLVLSALFAIGAPVWSPQMRSLGHVGLPFVVFVGVAAIAALGQLVDKIFVAFEAMHLVLLRNLIANVLRVGLAMTICQFLGASGLVLALGGGAAATFLLSITVLPRTVPRYRLRATFAWSMLRSRVGYTLGNHLAQLLWNAPTLLYPLLIVNLLGPRANARFYISWMVANLLFIVPTSVFTSSFARAANAEHLDEPAFWRTMRLTQAGLLLPTAVLVALAPFILHFFGRDYEAQGDLLFLLVVSVFPYTFNTAAIMYHRIKLNTARVVIASGLITLLCLGLSIAFGEVEGLGGIGVGWLLGQVLGVGVAGFSLRATKLSVSPANLQWITEDQQAGETPRARPAV